MNWLLFQTNKSNIQKSFQL